MFMVKPCLYIDSGITIPLVLLPTKIRFPVEPNWPTPPAEFNLPLESEWIVFCLNQIPK